MAVAFALTWAILYPLLSPFPATDLDVFIVAATEGDLTDYYYGPWLLPFYRIIAWFDYNIAHMLANVINVLCFLFAVSVFRGNKILFFTSYSLLFSIFYGQIDGLHAFGLAWMAIALRKDRYAQASIGWFIAIAKFYIGVPLGLGLLWCYANSRKAQITVIALTAVYGLVSLVIWPNWPTDLLSRMQANPPHSLYSIDTWSIFGPIVLLLWIPVLLSRERNYVWWVATWAMTLPYLHIHGLNQLLIMPVGLVGWLIQLNYLTGFNVSYYLLIIPLSVYLKAWQASWQTDLLSTGLRRLRHRTVVAQHENPDTSRSGIVVSMTGVDRPGDSHPPDR